VPRKYSPAPNERMLVEPEKYPAEFQKLVRASVDGDAKYQDAVLRVLADQLVGVSPDSESDAGAWSLVLGILTLLYGLVVGILGIINGGRLLSQSRKLKP
jgi:hypothetical protein